MSITSLRLGLLAAGFCAVGLLAQPVPLPFKPLDVQYDGPLDRLIMISANPDRVHIVNPLNGAETVVGLSSPPLSMSVSQDGTHVAVGHDGWISYVNLSLGYVENNLAISATVNTLVLAPNGSIWVPPGITVNAATGVQTISRYFGWSVSKPALHPNGTSIYFTRGGFPDDVLKGDISSGTFQFLYSSTYYGGFPVCAGIFYNADGSRLLTGCGTTFRLSPVPAADIQYAGSLSGATTVTAAADSATTRKFVVIPGSRSWTPNDDAEVQFYDDNYLNLLGRVPLPNYTSGSVTLPWHGRNVFYSSDATKLYVVLQADVAANLTNDYALYPLTLSTGSGCSPTLSANSTSVAASGGSVNVTVTATGQCLWQAFSNATWLNVQSGGVSSGNGSVTIQAGLNPQTVARTGTITIAGLTYTVTQTAAAAPTVNAVAILPVRPVAAEYSTPIDRMILVSASPNVLTILDPTSGTSEVLSLPLRPTSLSISPDGQHAAVGHDGQISYVNLTSAGIERIFPVSTNVSSIALGTTDIYAFALQDQLQPVRIVNIATGAEKLWSWNSLGNTGGRITPDGKYLYLNSAERYDISQNLPTFDDGIFPGNPRQWFSQDGARLFSGSGLVFRLSDIAAQDLQYSGTLEPSGLTAVADSSVQQLTAAVATGATTDAAIEFFGRQYAAAIGSVAIPKFSSGSSLYDGHGRYLFWNAAGNLLFAVIQADQNSGFLNDYAIYTVSVNGGCYTSLNSVSVSVPPQGGNFTAQVTSATGCVWKATSGASWLTVSTNAVSAGSAVLSYFVDPNPGTSARSGTISVAGQLFTVTQAAGTQVQLSALNTLPFRVVDAEYSTALDRIIALSSGPNRLNIYDPRTGINTPVPLPLAGNAVSVEPGGLRAAVCHNGSVSIVDLPTATIQKSVNISGNCKDIVLAGNSYVYASFGGGFGTMSSVNLSTGAETTGQLFYNGTTFRLNSTGDAIYTSDTGTPVVTRYSIANGPMTQDYQSHFSPTHQFGYKGWFTRDGRLVGDAGTVFRTGSTQSTDFIYTGTLSGVSGYLGAIAALDHSTARHLFASVAAANAYPPPPPERGHERLPSRRQILRACK